MGARRGAFFAGLIAAIWLLWPATASVQTTAADALFNDQVLHRAGSLNPLEGPGDGPRTLLERTSSCPAVLT